MMVSEQQMELISKEFENHGIKNPELLESLIDHMCCLIESNPYENFNQALLEAWKIFDTTQLPQLERETQLIINKQKTIMKGSMFILGYIAAISTTTGILFKTMHWPGANVLLITGIMLLNFGFLPLFFINRYKEIAH